MKTGFSAFSVPLNVPQQQMAGTESVLRGRRRTTRPDLFVFVDKSDQSRRSSHYFYPCDVLVAENNPALEFPWEAGMALC